MNPAAPDKRAQAGARRLTGLAARGCRLTIHSSRWCFAARPNSVSACQLRTKTAVTLALKEFIARREQRRITELLGQLEWDESFNPKAERSRK